MTNLYFVEWGGKRHCGVIIVNWSLWTKILFLLRHNSIKNTECLWPFFYSEAETIILSENRDKEYGPIAGLADFAKASANLAFGRDMKGLVRL